MSRGSVAPRVAVLDYGSGNLRSVVRACERVGAEVELTSDPRVALEAPGLVVPGVGAYAACMRGLEAVDGVRVVRERQAAGRPTLGICVGMQVLVERGVEHGVESLGCGAWPGTVERLDAPIVPHMGWSTVSPPADTVMLAGLEDERFYFVHSYALRTWSGSADARVTHAEHGAGRFVAAVEQGSLWAAQFHPEKSGDAGAGLLSRWASTLS